MGGLGGRARVFPLELMPLVHESEPIREAAAAPGTFPFELMPLVHESEPMPTAGCPHGPLLLDLMLSSITAK
jgi:hypothetical protein